MDVPAHGPIYYDQDEVVADDSRTPVTEVEVARTVIPTFLDQPCFPFRNGPMINARPLLIKPSFPVHYRWVPVTGHSSNYAKNAMSVYIKSHLIHVMDNKPTNMSASLARKVAIVLGVVRCMSVSYYSLTYSNLNPNEAVAPLIDAQVRLQPDGGPGDGSMNLTALPNYTGNHPAHFFVDLGLTDVEKVAVSAIATCAMGCIPMQGYSLIVTGRHYHPTSTDEFASKKAFTNVEMAYLSKKVVKEWMGEDKDTILDVLWHKATHPVDPQLMYRIAMDVTIAEKLVASGAAACASRLPAVEPEIRIAMAYIKLIRAVNPMLQVCQGGIDMSKLETLVEIAKAFPPLLSNPVIPVGFPEHLLPIVTNRASAVVALGSMLSRNAYAVAFCYGFYCAQVESYSMGSGTGRRDTLRNLYSFMKLPAELCGGTFHAGEQAFKDYHQLMLRETNPGNLNLLFYTIE